MKNTKKLKESRDRRFKITKAGEIHYHSDTKDIVMRVEKLIASLSLTTTQLYKYLAASSHNGKVEKYKQKEKRLIKAFVRLSEMPKNLIPSMKMRTLC